MTSKTGVKNWSDFLVEEPSETYTQKVMAAAAPELEKSRALSSRRWFSWNLAGGFALVAIALVGVGHMIKNAITTFSADTAQVNEQSETLYALSDLTEPKDFDLVADLDLIENLDNLEDWNGVDV